ncbi:MAG: 2-oxo acid dehydrogenase subunit E2 [Deltaproteobacteria bacterium]|nr:2-oxo acid dehydrogenase subunit E2 [Deltaproteobacteria bacterium]
MSFEFKLPDIGEGLHEGTLVEWLVAEGESVKLDQPFARVETDKAVVELPAPRAAKVSRLHARAGEAIQVGQVLVTFEDGSPSAAGADAARLRSGGNGSSGAADTSPPTARASSEAGRLRATPHTRALARRLGVDLTRVAPTGRGGKITDADVHRAAGQIAPASVGQPVATSPSAAPAPSASSSPLPPRTPSLRTGSTPTLESSEDGPVERVAVSHLRRVIAEAMSLSTRTAAHVTHVDEADVTDLLATYARAKRHLEADGAHKLSLLPYFLKAVVTALKDHPYLNASYDEARGELLLKRHYHLGIAVDTPEGLVVPVIRDVDRKDLVTLADEVTDLGARGRARRLQVHELRGGTFTVSSLGKLGGAFATPIIHQPEVAILGVHAIKDRPAVVDGAVVPRKLLYLSLSYDHRVVDGAVAARFMAQLLELVEHPDLLMLRL